jgi:hypothetical protein
MWRAEKLAGILSRAVSDANCALRPAKKPSPAMKRASHFSRAKVTKAKSISAELLAL